MTQIETRTMKAVCKLMQDYKRTIADSILFANKWRIDQVTQQKFLPAPLETGCSGLVWAGGGGDDTEDESDILNHF